MRFIVGNQHPGQRNAVFLIQDDRAFNLSEAHPGVGPDLMRLITDGVLLARIRHEGLGSQTVSASTITPGLPIAHPRKTLCVTESNTGNTPDDPAICLRSETSLIPAGAPLFRPAGSEKLGATGGLLIVIGQGGRHIAEESALGHVFGYTICIDGTVHDDLHATHNWTPGKNFDRTGAIGPVVVTPDELPPGAAGLSLQTRIGPDLVQDITTAELPWSVARSIAALSAFTTLQPGDLIALGRAPDPVFGQGSPRWLRPGDRVTVHLQGIGLCACPVQQEPLPG